MLMRINLLGQDSPKAFEFRQQVGYHSLLLPGQAGAIKGEIIMQAFIQKPYRYSVPI